MAEKYSLPGIEERMVPVGDSERLGYFITGTDVELEPQNVERFRNESESDVVRAGYTIYDPEQQGVHQFSPSGEYVGFSYAPRREGVGGFFGDVAEELGPILSMIPATAPYMAALNAAQAAKTGNWEKAAISALGAAAPIAGQFGASADTIAKLAEANKYARLASAVGSGRPEALLAAGAGFLPKDVYGHDPSMLNEGAFQYNQVFDPAEAGLVDMFNPSTAGYQFNTSAGGMEPDWSGYANLTGPELERLALGNFDQIDWSGYANLTEPELTELANQVSLNEAAAIANAQKSVDERLAAAKNAGKSTQKPAQEPSDLRASLGTTGPIPLVVPENAADIKLMDEIFGTSLSAPSTGNETDRDEALARLLRS